MCIIRGEENGLLMLDGAAMRNSLLVVMLASVACNQIVVNKKQK